MAALEQRFRVLEGKYKNEVPRALAAAKAEKERADRLEAELAESRKVAAAKPLVTEDEMKEFGEPLVGLQRRIAEEVTRPLLAQIEELKRSNGELGAQVKSTAQVGQSLNTQAFFTALDAKVPDWKAINEDKQFLAWLDGIDPLYGKPRQEILDEAQNSLDANRVGAFFVAYKADVQSRAAPRTEALESQITPSTTTGAPVNQNVPEKKIWTPATISKFYDDVRRGRISTEEAARIELDIHAAQREGRYKTR